MESGLIERLVVLSVHARWEEVLSETRSVALDERSEAEASQILFFEGLALLNLEQPGEARQAVLLGLEYASNRPELLDLAARVSCALGRPSEAAVYHERAIANAPESLQQPLLINYATTLFHEGSHSEALRLLRRPEVEGDASYESKLLCGRCYTALGQHRSALACFRRAARLKPRERAPRIGVANTLAALGRLTLAERFYAALAKESDDEQVTYNWATARLSAGDARGAIVLARAAAKSGKGSPSLSCVHAKALIEMDAVDAGLAALAKALPFLAQEPANSILFDEFSAIEAEARAENGAAERAREDLLLRTKLVRHNLPRSFSVLALMNDPPLENPQPWLVTIEHRAAGWIERMEVLAQDEADAVDLASEVSHASREDLASARTVVRAELRTMVPTSAEGLPPVRGVLERRRDLLVKSK